MVSSWNISFVNTLKYNMIDEGVVKNYKKYVIFYITLEKIVELLYNYFN